MTFAEGNICIRYELNFAGYWKIDIGTKTPSTAADSLDFALIKSKFGFQTRVRQISRASKKQFLQKNWTNPGFFFVCFHLFDVTEFKYKVR